MGGLVSALLLTLLVLPAIYYLLESRKDRLACLNKIAEAPVSRVIPRSNRSVIGS